jgi:putative DNA primase/helicase
MDGLELLRRRVESDGLVEGDPLPARHRSRKAAREHAQKFHELTDAGNAKRLVACHGHDLCFVPQLRSWFFWDEKRWRLDETGEVMRRAMDTARRIYEEAAVVDTTESRERFAKHAIKSESGSALREMVRLAECDLRVILDVSQLDADDDVLNVDNGVVDLETGQLLPHDSCRPITKLAPVLFDPSASCPRWESFIATVLGNDREKTAFVQMFAGYSLTGITNEQCFALLLGRGANGKSVLLEILKLLMGDYAVTADFSTFAERKSDGPRNDVARLRGARLVTASELNSAARLDEALLKSLTGQETISARFLHKETFEFSPRFKLWLAANQRPIIRGTDAGIWRRVRLIPFDVAIPAERQNKNLVRELAEELPGILNWAIAGLLEWRSAGLGTPAAIAEATADYRRESDVFGAFLEECCTLGDQYRETGGILYDAYHAWSRATASSIR